MLSESMKEKFINRFEKLVSNQQHTDDKNVDPSSTEKKAEIRAASPIVHYEKEPAEDNQNARSLPEVCEISSGSSDQAEGSQKKSVDIQALSKLIAI